MKFSELPIRKKHGWIYFSGFLMAGFVVLPAPLPNAGMEPLIAGVCFGVAAMIALFMLGKKSASEIGWVMSKQEQTPLVAQVEEPKQGKSVQQGVSFLTTILIAASVAAFLAIISVWYAQTHAGASSVAQKLVLVDGNAIFKAQVKVFAEGKDAGSPDAAQKAAKEFSVKLNAAIAPYKEAGYIILNSAMAMNIPEGLDITSRVAKQVGVEIQ